MILGTQLKNSYLQGHKRNIEKYNVNKLTLGNFLCLTFNIHFKVPKNHSLLLETSKYISFNNEFFVVKIIIWHSESG